MKILQLLLFQLLMLSGCSASTINAYKTNKIGSAPNSIKNIVNTNNNKCANLYNINEIWILENHCTKNKEQQGIYISDTTGTRRFNWYDKSFNIWAWQEECNSDKDCYYKVTTNNSGEIIELSYHFYINLSEGSYKLIIKNNKLIIHDKKIVDHPS